MVRLTRTQRILYSLPTYIAVWYAKNEMHSWLRRARLIPDTRHTIFVRRYKEVGRLNYHFGHSRVVVVDEWRERADGIRWELVKCGTGQWPRSRESAS
jgi:hypothetical protein